MLKHKVLLVLAISAMISASQAQTAHVMPGKWYDNIVLATDNNQPIADSVKTRFNVTADDEALIVKIEMKDPNAKDIRSLPKGKDGQWSICDSIEIFLDPGRTCANYQQVAVFANYSKWDRRWDKKLKTSWTYSLKINDDSWSVEVRLPFSDPGMVKPKTGDIWGFNVCRNVRNPKTGDFFSTWAHVGTVFNRPERFGMLVFGSPEEAEKALRQKVAKALSELIAELKQKGMEQEFSAQLKKMKKSCTEMDIRDIRDEMLVIENMKGLKK